MRSKHTLASVVLTACAALTPGCGAARSTPVAADPTPPWRGGLAAAIAAEGTGSVTVIDGDRLHGMPESQLEGMLDGRVAGLQVIRQPGGGISIRIRGPGSISGDTAPLYVVDGMPVQSHGGRGLYWLNPADVKRIEILKDAAAASIYGVRGGNGVVLITTRRWARNSEGRR